SDQFLEGRATRGHGKNPGADRSGAANIERRIADHQHFSTPQRALKDVAPTIARDGGDAVALFMIVGEGAGLKVIPQPEMPQLDFGAEANVAGEQAEHRRLVQGLALFDKAQDAFANVAVAMPQNL